MISLHYLYNSRWSPGGRKATSRSTGSGEASAAAIDSIILPTSLSSPPDETETYLVWVRARARARARARLRARLRARARARVRVRVRVRVGVGVRLADPKLEPWLEP